MRFTSLRRSGLVAVALAVTWLAAAAGFGRTAGAQGDDLVTFRGEIPPVGRSYRVMQNVRMTLLAGELKTVALSRIRDVKVLERDATGLTALRVEYREAVVQSGIRYIESGPDCVDGKTYVVRLGADGLAVAPVTGGAPTDAEKSYIRWDLGEKSSVRSLPRYLDGRTLRVGTDVPDPAGFQKALEPHLLQMGLRRVLNFTAKFKQVTGGFGGEQLAVFKVAFTVGEVRFLASTTMQLSGELQVRVPDGDLATFSLDGKFQTVIRAKRALRGADIRSGYFNGTQRLLPSLDLKIAGPSKKKKPAAPGPRPAAKTPAPVSAKAATPALATTLSWPREREASGARIVMHQPQVTRWAGNRLEARMAVVFTPAGESQPLIGSIDLVADTRTNLLSRRVTLAGLHIAAARFPARRDLTEVGIARRISEVVPTGPLDVALDRILVYQRVSAESLDVRRIPVIPAPPRILTAAAPGVLVRIDGAPDWAPIPYTGLDTVVNTPWDILRVAETGAIYLLAGKTWFTARALEGPWRPAASLPRSFRLVPPHHPRAAVRVAKLLVDEAAAKGSVTVVYEPAELIDLDGALTLTAIEGTDLMYARNTSRDLFMHLRDHRFFLLASGRWFAAPVLAGPWEVVKKLPDDFRRIPHDHALGWVRYSVPGTPEAAEGVMLAQIPVRAVLLRKEAVLAVTYDGAPDFREIRGTKLAYALNSPFDVVRADDRYYCCYRAAWFGAEAPGGPWRLTDRIPAAIHEMPPTSPVYHVSYVGVEDATPDQIAYRYSAGYLGCYVSEDGVVVFGTGVVTAPHIRKAVYYGRPWTFGMPLRYNPLSGAFGLRPDHRSPFARYDVRAGYLAARDDSRGPAPSPYFAWGDVLVGGAEKWRRAGHLVTAAGVERGFEADETAAAQQATVRGPEAASREDLIVGNDGVVYKRMPSGWYRFENETWTKLAGRPVRGTGKIHMTGVQEEADRRKRAQDRFNVFASWQEDM